MSKYVNADVLLELLTDQRDRNEICDVPFHVNFGLNQAIHILNSMEAKDVIYWNDKTSTAAEKSKSTE